MTNNILYDLFTFGSHTGSHLELYSYAQFAKVAKLDFIRYYEQNLLFYRDMAKYYYDFSLPVKETLHEVVILGCQILICFAAI